MVAVIVRLTSSMAPQPCRNHLQWAFAPARAHWHMCPKPLEFSTTSSPLDRYDFAPQQPAPMPPKLTIFSDVVSTEFVPGASARAHHALVSTCFGCSAGPSHLAIRSWLDGSASLLLCGHLPLLDMRSLITLRLDQVILLRLYLLVLCRHAIVLYCPFALLQPCRRAMRGLFNSKLSGHHCALPPCRAMQPYQPQRCPRTVTGRQQTPLRKICHARNDCLPAFTFDDSHYLYRYVIDMISL